MRRIRLLILDAQPVVRCGIRLFVEDSWELLTIFEAESAEEAIAVALRVKPTIVLLDAWLPDMLFPEAVERLRAASPAARFVLFAAHLAPAIRGEAVDAGIQAILGKGASPQQFRDVVSRVAAGEVIAPPPRDEVLRRAAEKLHRAPLTPHEHEILQRAARGESNAEIAKAIYLAPTTVKSYMQSALRKLDARNRVEAVYKLSKLEVL